ncbi:MAG TPA: PfkB family carbohydrate kinase [Clostridia bacterium]
MILTVCANVCIDEYVRTDNTLVLPAGKGVNVAISLKNIGLDSQCLMFMPQESLDIFQTYLKEHDVTGHYVLTKGKARINKKVIDAYGNITEYSGSYEPVDQKLEEEFIEKFEELSKDAQYIVISGSLPAGASNDFYKKLIEIAGGKKCILDSSREALKEGIKANPLMIKPNIFEFNALTGRHYQNEQEIVKECKNLVNNYGFKYILLSMGGEGALITDGKKAFSAHMNNDDIVNTTGAGDSMVAASIKCLKEGLGIEDILKCAVAAANRKIGHLEPFIKDTGYLEDAKKLNIKEIV